MAGSMNSLDLSSSSGAVARKILVLASVFAGLAVAAGAFGAHGLKGRVEEDLLPIFETGARYHMYHALALLGTGLLGAQGWLSRRSLMVIATLFAVGLVIFSGSLYTLTLTGVRRWGAVTPIGGVLLITAWAGLAGCLAKSSHLRA